MRVRFALTVVMLTLVVAACAGDSESDQAEGTTRPAETTTTTTTNPSEQPSAGCASPAPPPPGEPQSMTVDGTERTYRLSVPEAQQPTPMPLIVLLHGLGSSADDIISTTDMPARAAEVDTVVVTPQATGAPALWQPSEGGPDTAFIDALIADVVSRYCVDSARISFAGFSAGAAFAISYACAHQNQIAAIMTVSVEFAGACTKAMPILAFHGTADPIVQYGDTAATGTRANMTKWAATASCAPEPNTTDVSANVSRMSWTGCTADSEVVLYTIDGGAHTWPVESADANAPGVDATALALEFSTKHHLEAPSEFCRHVETLTDLIEQVQPGQPNLAAATRLVNARQQAIDTAPDADLRDAATHTTDAALAATEGREPTATETSSAQAALDKVAQECA